MQPRLFSSTDQVAAALEERVRQGCQMMMRDVRTIQEFARLKAELQNWEALNFTFLSGNFFDKSYSRKYYSLIGGKLATDVILQGAVDQLRERLENQLTFLASIREQLVEHDAESSASTLIDLVAIASAAARNVDPFVPALLRAS